MIKRIRAWADLDELDATLAMALAAGGGAEPVLVTRAVVLPELSDPTAGVAGLTVEWLEGPSDSGTSGDPGRVDENGVDEVVV